MALKHICWALLLIGASAVCAAAMSVESARPPVLNDLANCGTAVVTRIITGDHLQLEDGTHVRLADIKAPEYWPSGKAYRSWPYAAQAKAALTRLTLSHSVSLLCSTKPLDHLGRTVAHLVLADGTWVQESLVADGAAYAFASGKSTDIMHTLTLSEAAAKNSRSGLWDYKGMRPVMQSDGAVKSGWFQLVRGKILSATKRKDKTYLNFGPDYNTDFTVEIPKQLYRQFKALEIEMADFEGAVVEVRGWSEWAGGPKIIIRNALHIKIIGPDLALRSN